MRTPGRWVWSVLAVLAVTGAALGEVEKFAPTGAFAAVRVAAVDKTVQDVLAAGRLAGAQLPPILPYMALGREVANTPLGPLAQGFDPQGELLIVVLNAKTYKSPMVLVVPVTDYKKYVEGMLIAPGTKQVKDESGLDAIEFSMPQVDAEATAAARERGEMQPVMKFVTVRRYLANVGKWTVCAAAADACQAVAKQNAADAKSIFDLAEPAQTAGMRAKSILAVGAVQNLLEAYKTEIEAFKKSGFPMMPGMPGAVPGSAPPGPAARLTAAAMPAGGRMGPDLLMSFRWGLTPFSGPAAAWLTAVAPSGPPPDTMAVARRQMEMALDFVGQVNLAALGLDADAAGVRLTGWLSARPGTDFAAFTAAAPTGAPDLAKFLPAGAVLGNAFTVDPSLMTAPNDMAVKMLLSAGLPADQQAKIQALLKQQSAAMGRSVAVAVRQSPAGGPIFCLDQVMAVKDEAAAMQYFKDSAALVGPLTAATSGGLAQVAAAFTENVRTYGDHQISRLTLSFTAPDPKVKELLKGMYGDPMAVEVAVKNGLCLVALGGTDPLNRVIDAVKAGSGGLATTPAYKAAMSGLPARRDGDLFMSLKGLLSLVAAMTAAAMKMAAPPPGAGEAPEMLMPDMGAMMLNMVLAKVQGDLPLGGSLLLAERRLDLHVPAETLKSIGGVVSAMSGLEEQSRPTPGPGPAPEGGPRP
jgi:hypothetical protein